MLEGLGNNNCNGNIFKAAQQQAGTDGCPAGDHEANSWWLHTPIETIQYESSTLAWRIEAKGIIMKKTNRIGEMRAEYDFSHGVRGKYAKKYTQGTNLVLLDPDIAKLFPDSKTVNDALRVLAKVAKQKEKKAG